VERFFKLHLHLVDDKSIVIIDECDIATLTFWAMVDKFSLKNRSATCKLSGLWELKNAKRVYLMSGT
jgi:hypothetical protein